MNAVGLIFANMHDDYMPQLTSARTLASLPFGGRYRLIDFALSSMVNSDIYKVGVATRQNYQSLMDHLSAGKDWDLARRTGGLFLIPPFGSSEGLNPNATRMQALESSLNFLTHTDEEYVVVCDGDCVYNMDYNDMLATHLQSQNDITLAYAPLDFDDDHTKHTSSVTVNENGRVTDILVPNRNKGVANAVLNVYLLKRALLIDLVKYCLSHDRQVFKHDLIGKNIKKLKIGGYLFEQPFFFIDSVRRYFECNMKLLEQNVRDQLFNIPFRSVYTKVKDSSPTKYFEHAAVSNSFIADGCEIDGTVINCILFRNCVVKKGAVIKNSIIMQNGVIEENAQLDYCVTDKNVTVSGDNWLRGCEKMPYILTKNSKV